jgi:hypothetical protein
MSTSTWDPAGRAHEPAAGALASGGTLCVAGVGCVADARDDGTVLAGVGVDETRGAVDVVSPDVDATADVDGTDEVDGAVEVVAGVVLIGPAPPPRVVEAHPANPSAPASSPIPIQICLAVITRLTSPAARPTR